MILNVLDWEGMAKVQQDESVKKEILARDFEEDEIEGLREYEQD